MSELSFIPKADRADYGALAQHVKTEFQNWVVAIYELDGADSPREVAMKWAAKLGVSVKAVFSKRSLFRAKGWTALVNKRKAGPQALSGRAWNTKKELSLPPLAAEYLKKLYGDNKRKSRPAARKFVDQWKAWRDGDLSKRIPGFEECPKAGTLGYPEGWSVPNLMRYLPSKFELAAERRGQSYAVGKCGPQIFSTRAKLHYMSHIMLDDVWHDNFVNFQNQGICRVLELDALEVFSGALVFWGCKPRLKRDDGTFDQGLAKHVPLVFAALFSREGYSPLGTELLLEHGTAAASERVKKLLYDASDGLITSRESGITGEEQAVIGWRGQGKGNSRFKALLESHHNLKHNELADLPAQTGLSRDTRPEFTNPMLSDDDDLMKAARVLALKNPGRAAQLRTAILDYHSGFMPTLMDIYKIINWREWHEMEGWDQIPGNVVIEYRLSPTSEAWLDDADFQKLSPVSREVLLTEASKDKRYLRRRRLSPAAVQRRERGGLLKLPDWAIAELIGVDFAREMKVGGAYFNLISDEEISTEPLRFESEVIDHAGRRLQLPDDKYFCILNPFDPSKLFVHNAKQHFIGVAARALRIDRRDEETLRRGYGHQARRLNTMTAPLNARHAADIRAETKRLKANADVFAAQTSEETAVDRRLDRRAKRETGSLEDLGGAPVAPVESHTVSMEELNEL